MTYLERAHEYLGPKCPTLFFKDDCTPYGSPYWSQICTNALSFDDNSINATTIRHLFATAWRDYINTPSATLQDLSRQQLDAAAADLMCTSTDAYDCAYDDSTRQRGTCVVMDQWASFSQFVYDSHAEKLTET
jgi:hypothetical protein